MRKLALSLAVAVLAAATAFPAAADVTVAASAAFQEKLDDDYGVRELEELQGLITRAVDRELARVGMTSEAVRIAVTIEDARPNRPTFKQLTDQPGLSYSGSFGIGGAAFKAEILDAAGGVVETLAYDRFETDIRFASRASTWGDARRAINGFARDVAAAAKLAAAKGAAPATPPAA